MIFQIELDVVTISGADSESYLQGQLSQDLDSLESEDTLQSLLLTPQGKLVAHFRIYRLEENSFRIVVESGFGLQVIERLEQFKLGMDVQFLSETVSAYALRADTSELMNEELKSLELASGLWQVPAFWKDIAGVDIFDSQIPIELVSEDLNKYEALRIKSAMPKMGVELIEKTIPAAAKIVDDSVSFTKGCYVGQELIARIDSRGNNTPERLVRVWSSPVKDLENVFNYLQIISNEIVVGRVTSFAIKEDKSLLGLGYVNRKFESPGKAKVSSLTHPDLDIEVQVSDV